MALRPLWSAAALAVTTLLLAGCAGAPPAPPAPAAAPAAPAPATGEYRPVSDVVPHAAIGQDVGQIKKLLDVRKEGKPVDFAAVGVLFEQGGASKKGDGSTRTLATLLDSPETITTIREAVAGSGASAGASDGVRAQRVDKGITVLLADKVVDELGTAAEKVAAGNLDLATGAVHNVDEAWAFFTADGQGPASTADKRAADFKREGAVREPVIAALVAAQSAATTGDAAALGTATTGTRQGIDYVFYLATHKYLENSDEVGRAEGESFYRGIAPRVIAADAAADAAVLAAFASGDAVAGRAALNTPAVVAALGVSAANRV
ncbi:MAG: hypothetical protein ACT4RN_09590 [Pseudonocardia sp.]